MLPQANQRLGKRRHGIGHAVCRSRRRGRPSGRPGKTPKHETDADRRDSARGRRASATNPSAPNAWLPTADLPARTQVSRSPQRGVIRELIVQRLKAETRTVRWCRLPAAATASSARASRIHRRSADRRDRGTGEIQPLDGRALQLRAAMSFKFKRPVRTQQVLAYARDPLRIMSSGRFRHSLRCPDWR